MISKIRKSIIYGQFLLLSPQKSFLEHASCFLRPMINTDKKKMCVTDYRHGYSERNLDKIIPVFYITSEFPNFISVCYLVCIASTLNNNPDPPQTIERYYIILGVNSFRANKLRSASSVDDCVSWEFFIIRKKIRKWNMVLILTIALLLLASLASWQKRRTNL